MNFNNFSLAMLEKNGGFCFTSKVIYIYIYNVMFRDLEMGFVKMKQLPRMWLFPVVANLLINEQIGD